jgi:hypothetical protein
MLKAVECMAFLMYCTLQTDKRISYKNETIIVTLNDEEGFVSKKSNLKNRNFVIGYSKFNK